MLARTYGELCRHFCVSYSYFCCQAKLYLPHLTFFLAEQEVKGDLSFVPPPFVFM